ncbi:MAG: RNA polymerase sigma factor [Candidatus Krumholzibacteriota bacterium]
MGDSKKPHRDDGVSGDPSRSRPGSPLTAAVLEKVRQRDPQALAVLFDHHFSRIFGLAFRLLGEKTVAEDVTQEVFLRVHRAAHQLDTTRDPGPWLMTITANLCREKWRSRAGRQAKQTISLDEKPAVAAGIADGGTGTDRKVLDADRNRLLTGAIAELPEAMRLVVVLHDLQGLTHEEISGITGDEAAAVRKRYSRALRKLRELLPDGLV